MSLPTSLRFFTMSRLMAALFVLATGCASRMEYHPAVLTVMTYNIRHGEGMDGRLDLERIAAVINRHQPDLVALQEVDRGVARTQGRDLPAELAGLTGMEVVFGRNIDHQGGEYGNAILSRHPVIGSTNLHFRMLREGEQRGLLQAGIQTPHGEVLFMATHLDYRPDPAERLSNVAEIKSVARQHDAPLVIVAGDFNDHPGRQVHAAMKEAFVDAWEAVGKGDGFTQSSTNPRSRIDHVYLQPTGTWEVFRAEVLSSDASDHLPLLVELRRKR
jgi:endonuclease/exonuclease/phosphatase family metal-dependent hydrolase